MSSASSEWNDYWSTFNWNDAARDAVAAGMKLIPGYGTVVSALVDILWPQTDDVWSQIKSQVEALMNEEIAENVYQTVQDDLAGLNNDLDDYVSYANGNDVTNTSAQWITTTTLFDNAKPHFQSSGYELLLLPLYAQFVNLNLSLLRDGVLYGSSWGWTEDDLNTASSRMSALIKEAVPYANQWYEQGLQTKVNGTKRDDHACEPFRTVNTYVREMTLNVIDFANLWPSFAVLTPNTVYLSREIYSDPVGTCDNSGEITLPSAPTQPISQIVVWGWDRIDAVQLSYPPSGGPAGKTITARMGDQSGGSNASPHGGTFQVTNNPVTIAAGHAGDILNSFKFTFQDGTDTGTLGGGAGGGTSFSFSYQGEILSSIHINGVSTYYGSADCAVFGFKFPK
jgi:hypothetical protein